MEKFYIEESGKKIFLDDIDGYYIKKDNEIVSICMFEFETKFKKAYREFINRSDSSKFKKKYKIFKGNYNDREFLNEIAKNESEKVFYGKDGKMFFKSIEIENLYILKDSKIIKIGKINNDIMKNTIKFLNENSILIEDDKIKEMIKKENIDFYYTYYDILSNRTLEIFIAIVIFVYLNYLIKKHSNISYEILMVFIETIIIHIIIAYKYKIKLSFVRIAEIFNGSLIISVIMWYIFKN